MNIFGLPCLDVPDVNVSVCVPTDYEVGLAGDRVDRTDPSLRRNSSSIPDRMPCKLLGIWIRPCSSVNLVGQDKIEQKILTIFKLKRIKLAAPCYEMTI